MTEEVIENQETVQVVPCPVCAVCKKEMHDKGMKPKEISSMIGEVKLNRGYYEELSAAVTYFHHNHKRMQYMEFREDGFPIGSGMVESAAKQFKARFTAPGMRWSRKGLQRLIPIRSALLSHSFDHLWDSVFSSLLN